MGSATVTLLGAGTMGEALLTGTFAGGFNPASVTVTSRRQERVDELVGRHGVHGTTDAAAAVHDAALVIVALPPAHVLGVLTTVRDHLRRGAVVVSLADGASLDDLASVLPEGTPTVRAMPSLTARVGEGVTLLSSRNCSGQDAALVEGFFRRSGTVLHVEEDEQPALAPLSSSGSAHALYLADAMVEAAAVRGVPRDQARSVVAQALAGAAALMQDGSDADPATLRAQMCAPGGAGIRRIAMLDRHAVRAAVVDALTD